MTIEILVIGFLAALCLFLLWKLQQWKLKWHLAQENLQFVKKSHEELKEAFAALSHDALEKNNRSFLDLAKTSLEKFQEGAKNDLDKREKSIHDLVKPVKETLGKLDEGLNKLEKERKGDQASIKTQVHALMEAKKELTKETSNLVKALRTPLARGRWGEIQLRRVVEMAGMLSHCDFYEQSVFL